jgi:hypothetical protein
MVVYCILDTTPQQLANYLLVLPKTAIFEQQAPPHTRLSAHVPHEAAVRLYTEMHYSLWASYMDTFRGYWLHRDVLGKPHDGKITLSDQIYRPPYIPIPSDCLSDAIHNHHIL